MGIIRKMAELLKAAGFEVHDVSRPNISRGAGFHGDEWGRLSEYDGKPDPPGVITTNYQPPKPKAIKVDTVRPNVPVDKRRGRPKKRVNAVHKSMRPLSLFDLLKRLKGGKK